MLFREPPLAVRVIREEFNSDYRGVIIDDHQLFEDVHSYVQAFNPELADRVVSLLGADVANLYRIREIRAPAVSIGGAGTFDGIFLTGILAVLLA